MMRYAIYQLTQNNNLPKSLSVSVGVIYHAARRYGPTSMPRHYDAVQFRMNLKLGARRELLNIAHFDGKRFS
ncbi:MAG: hypothetical protein AAGG48_09455 [Planctomycetota bacterium]